MAEGNDTTRRRRRLAAILMADIAGFSRLMGKDEEGTTSHVLLFHERVRSTVESFGGRVVATAGDSVFGDFDSVVEALDCAAEIQKDLHVANEGFAADDRIDARIGLHLGDVIVEEYNVFGDGVNIAARLEQLADPGGIVFSEAVYQQVKGRSEWPITDMGTRTLKNIDEPIRLFRIGPEAFGDDPEPSVAPVQRPASGKDEAIRTIRDLAVEKAIGAISDKIEIEDIRVEGTADGITFSMGGRAKGWMILFAPATLVTSAVGVLLVMARFSGWSDTGWYPFLGFAFLGLAAGMVLEVLSRRKGVQLLMQAVGVATGAWFVPGTVMRAVLWMIAASMLGASLQRLAKR